MIIQSSDFDSVCFIFYDSLQEVSGGGGWVLWCFLWYEWFLVVVKLGGGRIMFIFRCFGLNDFFFFFEKQGSFIINR